jgi:hypothetical protein
VVGEQELKIDPAGLPYPGGIGMNHHSVADRLGTGGLQGPAPLHLHHANPAHPFYIQVFVIAKGGNGNPGSPGRRENRTVLRYFYFTTVDGYFNHFHTGHFLS